MKGLDVDAFLGELRLQRRQDSQGRPDQSVGFLLDSDIAFRYRSGDSPTKALVDLPRARGISIGVTTDIEVAHGILVAPDTAEAIRGLEEWLDDVPVFGNSKKIAFWGAVIRVVLTVSGR